MTVTTPDFEFISKLSLEEILGNRRLQANIYLAVSMPIHDSEYPRSPYPDPERFLLLQDNKDIRIERLSFRIDDNEHIYFFPNHEVKADKYFLKDEDIIHLDMPINSPLFRRPLCRVPVTGGNAQVYNSRENVWDEMTLVKYDPNKTTIDYLKGVKAEIIK